MTAAGRAPRASVTGRAGPQIGLLLGGLLLLTVIAVLSMGVGARHIPPAEVVRALFDHQGTDDHVIVRDVRLPRALLAIAVGAALAVVGALIQTLARNPLAEPGILGVTAGAGFAVTVGSALGLATGQAGELGFAITGSVLASLLVAAVGQRSPLRLVLTGVALTAVLGGVALGMRLMLPDAFDTYRFWSVGSLAGREQAPLALPLAAIAVSLLGALLLSRALNALTLGANVAHTLGRRRGLGTGRDAGADHRAQRGGHGGGRADPVRRADRAAPGPQAGRGLGALDDSLHDGARPDPAAGRRHRIAGAAAHR